LPVKGWMKDSGGEGVAYATAFGTLLLGVPEGRLSIYNRTPPTLPGPEGKARGRNRITCLSDSSA
jgi:hypothetical protein